MFTTYHPPIAVALGCVAPKLSPHESARLTEQALPHGPARGLGLADIISASARAGADNGLRFCRKLRGDLIGR
jgi:hypothetical protein